MTDYSESSARSAAVVLGCAVVTMLVSGAFGCSEGTKVCTTEEVPSVMVYVEGENGATLENPAVEFRRKDKNEEYRDCGSGWQVEGMPRSYEFSCGGGAAGVIELRATTTDGKSGEAEVTVVRGECHVRTESVTIVVN